MQRICQIPAALMLSMKLVENKNTPYLPSFRKFLFASHPLIYNCDFKTFKNKTAKKKYEARKSVSQCKSRSGVFINYPTRPFVFGSGFFKNFKNLVQEFIYEMD